MFKFLNLNGLRWPDLLQKSFKFCCELQKCIPDAEIFTRKNIPLKKVVQQAKEKEYSDLIVVHEDRKVPSQSYLTFLII